VDNDFQTHVDNPTFHEVLAACKKRGVRVTVTVRDGASVTCRIEMSGNVARIDFDLFRLGSDFSEDAQRRFNDKHSRYVKANIKQMRPKKPGITGAFGRTGIAFQVLAQDAESWFDEVYVALQHTANFTSIPDPFEMFKKTKSATEAEPKKKPTVPKQPPAEPREIETLRTQLKALERPTQPRTPETLKAIQRVLKTYERPSAITMYVKENRGSNCQLCGYEGFRKRNGTLYCEVHHLFHLSKNPPPMCLGPEYLVVLCATCHRRMHYADVGEPTRIKKGWRVRIDGEEVLFDVSVG
jgi:hypothetical protein